MLSRWLRDGRYWRRYPTVYVAGPGPLTWEGELTAALFYAGPGAALAHLVACNHWEAIEARPLQIDVVAPGRRRPQPGLRIHRSRNRRRVWHREFPVVPLATALRQSAPQLGLEDLRMALSEAEYRKVLIPAEVEAELGRGKPGSALLRRAWRQHNPRLARTKKELERRFFALWEESDLPAYEPNFPISRMRVDAAWPDRMHCTELDSRLAHGTSNRSERDLNRELVLRRLGWTVSRYSWEQVTERPEEVIEDLRHLLGCI